jgi:hypothetical protein
LFHYHLRNDRESFVHPRLLYCREEKLSQVRAALAHLLEMLFRVLPDGTQVLCDEGQNGLISGPGLTP